VIRVIENDSQLIIGHIVIFHLIFHFSWSQSLRANMWHVCHVNSSHAMRWG